LKKKIKNKKYVYNKISVNYTQKIPHSMDLSPFEELAVSQEIPFPPQKKSVRFITVQQPVNYPYPKPDESRLMSHMLFF
jgi:hypothetical protein